jgi:hypothetical protein
MPAIPSEFITLWERAMPAIVLDVRGLALTSGEPCARKRVTVRGSLALSLKDRKNRGHSAGNAMSAVLPQAKKRSWSAVKRVRSHMF